MGVLAQVNLLTAVSFLILVSIILYYSIDRLCMDVLTWSRVFVDPYVFFIVVQPRVFFNSCSAWVSRYCSHEFVDPCGFFNSCSACVSWQ